MLDVATDESRALVVTASFQGSHLHVWDCRQLPLEPAGTEWDELSRASRRGLVATVSLPEGTACARGVQLSDAQLAASLDYDTATSAFSRAAQSVALFDFRAVA